MLLRFVTHNSLKQIVLLCALLALIGCSLTLLIAPLMAEIAHVVAEKEAGNPSAFGGRGAYAQAYGLYNCAFAAGTLIGPIWGGFMLSNLGWGTMSWTLGLLSIVTAVPTMIYVGN